MLSIKICGITCEDHAAVVAEAGADFIGFVFAPSRRRIEPDRAKSIIESLDERRNGRRPKAVGVFVNSSPAEINRMAAYCHLDLVQLHGDEPPEMIGDLAKPVIRALRLRSEADLDHLEEFSERGARLLVNAYDPARYGGSGIIGDWRLAATAAERYEIILAGGLQPGNVGEAIAQVHPWGVDVSSGVERDGVKAADLILAFVDAARAAAVKVQPVP